MSRIDRDGLHKLMLRKGYVIVGFTIRDIRDGAYLGSADGIFVADTKAIAEEVLTANLEKRKAHNIKISKIRVAEIVQHAHDMVVAFSVEAYTKFNALACTEGLMLGKPENKLKTPLHGDNQKVVLFGVGE